MTPRHYLRKYQYDTRLVTGRFYSSDPVTVERGDRVGVVLFHLGGPDSADTVTPFLFNLFMDPVLLDLPGGGMLRPWLSRFIASVRGKSGRKACEAIGRSPEEAGLLTRTMLIGQAVSESTGIYALVIAFIMLFRG